MKVRLAFLMMCFGFVLVSFPLTGVARTGDVFVGKASYVTTKPDGVNDVQSKIWKSDQVTSKMPTNDWWSSLAWDQYSQAQYPHPLAVKNTASGFQVYDPGSNINSNASCICAWLPPDSNNDFLVGHSGQLNFPDAKVDGFNDWFVRALYQNGSNQMRVTYGHGSPFVFFMFQNGNPAISFQTTPEIWFGSATSNVLGVTINNHHYAFFGSTGSTWEGIGTKRLINQTNGKPYFSIVLLPERSEKALNFMKTYAYNHVTDTKVTWSYDQNKSQVLTTYRFVTDAKEGNGTGTVFALYPHQWKYVTTPITSNYQYASVRGKMKVSSGDFFQTTMTYQGILPFLPEIDHPEQSDLKKYVKEVADATYSAKLDTYWMGKQLGKLALVVPMAERIGDTQSATKLRNYMKSSLENWFTSSEDTIKPSSNQLFYYNSNWGTLLGYPDSYGSAEEMNDHHFHYGYFIKAAAEIARTDKTWASTSNWGGLVNLLIRDIASSNRSDELFPFLRNFDIYAGHSWASGHARFGDGNNNESSSEAMNAWAGLIQWGEATNDRVTRDLGIYLYTTEMNAINEYWFDLSAENFPVTFTRATASMIWGGKTVGDGVWWTANPEEVHGINWLPFTGASYYLGKSPAYIRKNLSALTKENGGSNWNVWSDLIWMYQALADPGIAYQTMNANMQGLTPESGNSKAAMVEWITFLYDHGTVDSSVTANTPLYRVFQKENARTYAVYNMQNDPIAVRFSDGKSMVVPANVFKKETIDRNSTIYPSATPSTKPAEFVQKFTVTANGDVNFIFQSTRATKWVDLHYRINGGIQQNVRMVKNGGQWTYLAKHVAKKSNVQYSFTYEKNALAVDSVIYAMNPTIAPTASPVPTSTPRITQPQVGVILYDSWKTNKIVTTESATIPADLREISGIVASRKYANTMWAIEDSGNSPKVYALGLDGSLKATITLTGATNYDWEDIAIRSGPKGDELVIGDIGDNAVKRSKVTFYVISEPDLSDHSVVPTVITATYTTGATNAEAMVATKDGIWVISKTKGTPNVFALNLEKKRLEPVQTFVNNPGLVTAADISPIGDYVAVRTYADLRITKIINGDLAKALSQSQYAKMVIEPQGESVAFLRDGSGIVTISEGEAAHFKILRAKSN